MKGKLTFKNKYAASEIVGGIFLIAIVVLAFTAISISKTISKNRTKNI